MCLKSKISGRAVVFIRNIGVFLFIFAAHFSGSELNAADIPRFEGKPVDVADRFETDTRNNYQVRGADWSTHKLGFAKDAVLAYVKTIKPDLTCELDIWPQQPRENEQCVSKINLVFSSGLEAIIIITRVRQKNQTLYQVFLAEARKQPDKPQPVVDEIGRSAVFSVTGDVERWKLRYTNGVLQITCNSQPAVSGYSIAGTSWTHIIAVSQAAGSMELSRFELHGHEIGYTKEQREVFDRTNAMQADAEKAKAAGDVRSAVRIQNERIPLLEQTFGSDDMSVGLAHQWIAELAEAMQHWQTAKDRYELALHVYEKFFGPDHPFTCFTRLRVAREIGQLGDWDKAETIARPALTSYLQVASRGDGARVAAGHMEAILAKQAEQRLAKGEYPAYQQYCEEIANLAVQIRPNDMNTGMFKADAATAKRLAEASHDQQDELAGLVRAYLKLRNDGSQTDLVGRANAAGQLLATSKKLLGGQDLMTADLADRAGDMEFTNGNFGKAVALEEEGLAIRKKITGENDSGYAFAEGHLASCYSMLDRFGDATPRFQHALQTLAANGQAVTREYAIVQLEYARNLGRTNQSQDAEVQLLNVISIHRQLGAPGEYTAMKASERLAAIYRATGRTAQADELLETQKKFAQGTSGDATVAQIEIMMQEGAALYYKAQFAEAAKKYREICARVEKLYGKRNRGYEFATAALLEVDAAAGDYKGVNDAFAELLEFARLRRESLFDQYTLFQQFERSASDRPWLNRLMALATNHIMNEADAYDHLLEIKGAVTLHERRTQLAASRPELKDLVKRRQEISSQLSSMYVRSVSQSDMPKVENLLAERTTVEHEMTTRSAAYSTVATKVTLARLRELLPENVTIIDFVEFERPPDWLQRLITSAPQPQIAAFALSKHDGPKLVDLGPSARIDSALAKWARAILKESKNLVRQFDPQLEQDTDQAGATMRELIWDPLEPYVKKGQTIVISPDGPLLGCPFPAIPMKDKSEFLIERNSLSQVPAVGLIPELLRPRGRPAVPKLLAVADVDYNLAPAKTTSKTEPTWTQDRAPFRKLPPSNGKVDLLFKHAFPSGELRQLAGASATEPNVRASLPGASILYLYTHGFSVPLSELRSIAKQQAESDHSNFNPLVAGVALAGANHALFTEDSSDGILWASEIATLNLESTELVTLVACETALGDIIPGEGMQGCQRALTVAGAHTSLASIWSVLAAPAEVLTDRFYENLLAKRLSRAESLQQAMRHMIREFDWSDGRKLGAAHRAPPFLWSSWVLSGDWR